jgi:hypothetical protein
MPSDTISLKETNVDDYW